MAETVREPGSRPKKYVLRLVADSAVSHEDRRRIIMKLVPGRRVEALLALWIGQPTLYSAPESQEIIEARFIAVERLVQADAGLKVTLQIVDVPKAAIRKS